MNEILNHETGIRLGIFAGVLALMALLEAAFPKKQRAQGRGSRWITNLSLIVIDSVALRLALPIFAIGVSVIAADKGWGLLNLLAWPAWIEIIIAIVLLDMLIYWQHVASHRLPLLWRLHKVHHADRDIDVTTGVRFHPIEIIFSMLYKMVCIVILGPAVMAVLLFEVLLNACALFNHANLRLPRWLDLTLRIFIVTPDMHRVHHSVIEKETNSNYGFSLSLWDRIFGSYIAQPKGGHDDMTIGLSEHQNERPASLLWVLALPFQKKQ